MELQPDRHRTRVGKKAFGVWGVEVLNEVRCETPARSELSDPDPHLPMPLYPFHMDEAPVRSLHGSH